MAGTEMPAFSRKRRASGILGVKTVVSGRMCLRRFVMAEVGRSWAPEVATMTCQKFENLKMEGKEWVGQYGINYGDGSAVAAENRCYGVYG